MMYGLNNMPKIPRVFVGTLYSGEGDFEKCNVAIQEQLGVSVDHLVIKHLPEKEAHNALWAEWRSRQSSFDFFVKVDADTVLSHPNVLNKFWETLQSNPRITGIQAPLHDYFTDRFINGLNCFSPKVIFQDTKDSLFCDRKVDINHDIMISSDNVCVELKPAGKHCHNSSDLQAFHFGFHRALKRQNEILQFVRQAWDRDHDRLREFAILGAGAAFSKGFLHMDYTTPVFVQLFEEIRTKYDNLRGTLKLQNENNV